MRRKRALLVSLALLAAGPALAADALDGATLFSTKGCIACHGSQGANPTAPMYPILAGQNEPYLLNQMNDIASGARNNGHTEMMKPVIGVVSADERNAIAKWLSTQQGVK